MTKEVLNTVPEWQMDDAYGSLTDPRWMASGDRLVSLTNQIAELTILVKRCATRSPSTKTHSLNGLLCQVSWCQRLDGRTCCL